MYQIKGRGTQKMPPTLLKRTKIRDNCSRALVARKMTGTGDPLGTLGGDPKTCQMRDASPSRGCLIHVRTQNIRHASKIALTRILSACLGTQKLAFR